MRRLLVYGFHSPELYEAVQAAVAGSDACVVHWIGVNRPGVTFDDDILRWHLGEELFGTNDADERSWSSRMPGDLVEWLQSHASQITEQLSRNPMTLSWHASQYWDNTLALAHRFCQLLHTKQIDLLLFQNLPHEGVELILYYVARFLQIPTLLCYQSVLPRRFFYCRDLADFGWFKTANEYESAIDFKLPSSSRIEWFYMRGVTPGRLRARWTANQLWGHWKAEWGYYRWRRRSDPRTPMEQYLRQLQLAMARRPWRGRREFVYFPLQLQPELTTSAIGDEFSDQAKALETLAKWLPADVDLVVKENPKQDYRFRNTEFFRRLAAIPQLRWAPPDTPSSVLLEGSILVATITGTVGWEALLAGRSCVVLGRPWYLTLPGVVPWSPQLDFAHTIAQACRRADLEAAFPGLWRKSRRGVVDVNYAAGLSDYDPQVNRRDVASALQSLISETSFANR